MYICTHVYVPNPSYVYMYICMYVCVEIHTLQKVKTLHIRSNKTAVAYLFF